jgi:hypothetical protein
MAAAVQFISNPNFTNVPGSVRTATIGLGGVPESPNRYVIPYAMFVKPGGRNTIGFKANNAESFVAGQQLQTSTASGQATVVGKPINVPTGTTVELVHTLDGQWTRHGIGLAVVTGVSAASALGKFLSFSGTSDGSTDGAAIAYPDNGLLLAVHQNVNPGNSLNSDVTFTGVDATPIGDSTTTNANLRGIVRSYAGHTPAEASHSVVGTMNVAGSHIMSLYTFSADDGSGTPVTVTLNDMVQGRIVQRVPGTTAGNLKVTGGFTGPVGQNPANAQARVMSGSTVVKDWTTLTSATIDGGGGITGTLAGIPQGDGYTLQLRTRDAGGTELARAVGTNTWGVGLLVGVLGSSSADNIDANDPGSVVLSPLCRKNDVYEGTRWTGNSVGGGIRQIANAILANLPAGVPVGFVCGGIGGSCLTAAANDQNHWGAGSNNYNAYRDRVLSLEGFVEFQIGCVGSNDIKTSAGFQGVTAHVAALQSLVDRSRAAFGQPNLPMFWLGAQRSTLTSAPSQDAGWIGLSQAEETFTTNNPNVYYASTMKDLPIDGGDYIHPTNAAYRSVGARIGRFIAATLFGDTKPYRGPKVAGYVYNPANGIVEVTFDLRGMGDAIVGAQGSQENIVGFRASTDNFATRQPISSARITAANKVQLVIPPGLSGVKVDYMGGWNHINFLAGDSGCPAGNTICGNAAVVAS